MKIGLVSIYSFRPHVEHMDFLAELLQRGGHSLSFLTCDSSLPNCYARTLKGNSKLVECPKCIIGGIRSYRVRGVQRINANHKADLDSQMLEAMTLSSSCTLARTETEADQQRLDVRRIRESLHEPVAIAYENACRWIRGQNLDGVICFNGRMDATRAVTMACEHIGIPFVTCERSWFGHGLRLIPNENCLALREQDRVIRAYRDKPLREDQAKHAGKLASERFLQRNVLEWRVYNASPESTAWPVADAGTKVLILPSSRNEFEGHADWATEWRDYGVAFTELLQRLGLGHEHCVLRCHPNWSESIGIRTGELSEQYYTKWCLDNGVHVISSNEKASTYDLISQADLVVVNGSTAGVEAGLCGKKIVCLGHAFYRDAGFAIQIPSSEHWDRLAGLDEHDVRRVVARTLRYIYAHSRRTSQFVDYVRAVTTTKYEYYCGADPEQLTQLLLSGRLQPDDPEYDSNSTAEDNVVEQLLARRWQELSAWNEARPPLVPQVVGRIRGLGWLDSFRELFPRGDR